MPHIHDKIDFTADVYIVNNNKVLLRKHDKIDIWCVPGGHIELHEDPVEAAIREAKEEVGLDIEIVPTTQLLTSDKERYKHIITPAFVNQHKINNTHDHISFIYFAKTNQTEIINEGREKSDECKWVTLEELDNQDISETVKEYAKAALELINKLPKHL